jgi:uncharacterized protein YndB with AHSA1/START domain
MNETTITNDRELGFARLIDLPREKLFRAWTDPRLMEEWFCPKPWFVSDVEIDVRPGGRFSMFINGPNGEKFPNNGLYLDVVPNERLVFTDAFVSTWEPSNRAFMVATVTFEDRGGKTLYTARAAHWSTEARAEHEKMGFHDGWNKAADQMIDVAATL